MCLFVGLNKPICIKCLYHSLTYGEHHQILEGLNLLRAFQVALVTKNLPANAGGARDADSMPGSAILSSILAWKIPWTEELGGL